MRVRSPLLSALLLSSQLVGQTSGVEFEPKVGATGSRVVLKTSIPADAQVRFGGRLVTVFREADGTATLMVPPGAASSFIELSRGGKVVARSAVPFVVTGGTLVPGTTKLVGLKEAIDVFGYFETRPEGGEKPESPSRPVFKLDDQDILTLGEAPPSVLGPAVELGDVASATRSGMGTPGLLFTARAPRKKKPLPSTDGPIIITPEK